MHSATLGKGKKDDTLVRVKRGDLTGKGEVTLVFGKQVRFFTFSFSLYSSWLGSPDLSWAHLFPPHSFISCFMVVQANIRILTSIALDAR